MQVNNETLIITDPCYILEYKDMDKYTDCYDDSFIQDLGFTNFIIGDTLILKEKRRRKMSKIEKDKIGINKIYHGVINFSENVKDYIAVVLISCMISILLFGVCIFIISFLLWQSPLHIIKVLFDTSHYSFCIRVLVVVILLIAPALKKNMPFYF